MNEQRRMLIILLVLCIFVAGLVTAVSINSKPAENKISIRSDKEPLLKRFSNLGEIKSCYWVGGQSGSQGWAPGPSSYYLKGFIEIDKQKIESFIEKYNMKEIKEIPETIFFSENYNMNESKWLHSKEFDEYITPHNLYGYFYIENVNKVIYFYATSK